MVIEFIGPAGCGKSTLIREVGRVLDSKGFQWAPLSASYHRLKVSLCFRLFLKGIRLLPSFGRRQTLSFWADSIRLGTYDLRSGIALSDNGLLQRLRNLKRCCGEECFNEIFQFVCDLDLVPRCVIVVDASEDVIAMRQVERDGLALPTSEIESAREATQILHDRLVVMSTRVQVFRVWNDGQVAIEQIAHEVVDKLTASVLRGNA
ncbi:MAG: hypothetical protein ACXIUL_00810 [Wenzhouxiangella sp.]